MKSEEPDLQIAFHAVARVARSRNGSKMNVLSSAGKIDATHRT
jgi:hypothetical protein